MQKNKISNNLCLLSNSLVLWLNCTFHLNERKKDKLIKMCQICQSIENSFVFYWFLLFSEWQVRCVSLASKRSLKNSFFRNIIRSQNGWIYNFSLLILLFVLQIKKKNNNLHFSSTCYTTLVTVHDGFNVPAIGLRNVDVMLWIMFYLTTSIQNTGDAWLFFR